MPAIQGALQAIQTGIELVPDVSSFTREVFFNDNPIITRLPRKSRRALTFKIQRRGTRPRIMALAAAIADGVATSCSVTDGSGLMVGDVLQLASGEHVEVTAQPTVTNTTTGQTTLTIKRGVAGTTGAAQSISTAVTLISNARLGNEVDQEGYRIVPTEIEQIHQRTQYPVTMGGELLDVDLYLPPQYSSPFEYEREQRLVDMYRDAESALLYGRGEAPAAGGRRKTKGLRYLLPKVTTAGDITDEAAYTPESLYRDVIQPIQEQGGDCDVIFHSVQAGPGFMKWGMSKSGGVDLGVTRNLGVRISGMVAQLGGKTVTFVPTPLLGGTGNITFLGVDTRYIALSVLHPESWYDRAKRGDRQEGEWLFDFASDPIDVNKHAWVEGVTGFGNA